MFESRMNARGVPKGEFRVLLDAKGEPEPIKLNKDHAKEPSVIHLKERRNCPVQAVPGVTEELAALIGLKDETYIS